LKKETTCGMYYKPMTIVNDDFWVINKLEASLTDDARVVIYDHLMFIVQATRANVKNFFVSYLQIGYNLQITDKKVV
jgi:hypothetical protein